MLVKYSMTNAVISVDEDVSVMQSYKLMEKHDIKNLSVVKERRLVGVVSDWDLTEEQPSGTTALDIHELYYLLDRVKTKSLMSTNLHTTTAEEVVERAAALMLDYDISSLPVFDQEGKLKGIVIKGDLFRGLIAISGIHQAQLQLGLEVEDRSGAGKEITDLIRTHGGRIVNITPHHEEAPEVFRHLSIRCKAVENEEALFEDLGENFKIRYRTLYKVDASWHCTHPDQQEWTCTQPALGRE
jgi:acetoin utilization protein AcuB